MDLACWTPLAVDEQFQRLFDPAADYVADYFKGRKTSKKLRTISRPVKGQDSIETGTFEMSDYYQLVASEKDNNYEVLLRIEQVETFVKYIYQNYGITGEYEIQKGHLLWHALLVPFANAVEDRHIKAIINYNNVPAWSLDRRLFCNNSYEWFLDVKEGNINIRKCRLLFLCPLNGFRLNDDFGLRTEINDFVKVVKADLSYKALYKTSMNHDIALNDWDYFRTSNFVEINISSEMAGIQNSQEQAMFYLDLLKAAMIFTIKHFMQFGEGQISIIRHYNRYTGRIIRGDIDLHGGEEINAERFLAIKNRTNEFFEIIDSCSDVNRRIMKNAIHRFGRAMLSADDSDAIVEMAIGIEALLVSQGSDISYRFRLFGTLLLKYFEDISAFDHSEVFENLKRAYDIRSKMVHAGEAAKDIKMLKGKILFYGTAIIFNIVRMLKEDILEHNQDVRKQIEPVLRRKVMRDFNP